MHREKSRYKREDGQYKNVGDVSDRSLVVLIGNNGGGWGAKVAALVHRLKIELEKASPVAMRLKRI